MAQVDIGKIKIVWKGPWNSGTPYTIDDAVSHGGSSWISIQAGTNQNPSTATAYWQEMASKGTDADLINISGTVQGDFYYNNGSAIARLAPGTNGQVLKTGGASANPSWGTVSSEYVKLYSNEISGATTYDFDYFSNDYENYELFINAYSVHSDGGHLRFQWRTSSGVASSNDYIEAYKMTSVNTSSSGTAYNSGNWGANGYHFIANGMINNLTYPSSSKINMFNVAFSGTTKKPMTTAQSMSFDSTTVVRAYDNGHVFNSSINPIGFRLSTNGSNNWVATVRLYGVKK